MPRPCRPLFARAITVFGAALLLSAPPLAAQPVTTVTITTGSKVDQYLVTPQGVVDGLLLQDNTVVRFAPNLRDEIAQSVRPGDSVVVTGIPEGTGQLHASRIEDRTTQRTISEIPPSGPAPATGESQLMTVSGTIRVVTRAPGGAVDGVVLSNGTVVHFPPEAAAFFDPLLHPDQPIAGSGWGIINPYGKSVEASALGPSVDKLTPVPRPPAPSALPTQAPRY